MALFAMILSLLQEKTVIVNADDYDEASLKLKSAYENRKVNFDAGEDYSESIETREDFDTQKWIETEGIGDYCILDGCDDETDLDSFTKVKEQAKLLPGGWFWTDYDDGSGRLKSPDGKSFFSYDLCTMEYKYMDNENWLFWKDYPQQMYLSEFKEYAEKCVLQKICENK